MLPIEDCATADPSASVATLLRPRPLSPTPNPAWHADNPPIKSAIIIILLMTLYPSNVALKRHAPWSSADCLVPEMSETTRESEPARSPIHLMLGGAREMREARKLLRAPSVHSIFRDRVQGHCHSRRTSRFCQTLDRPSEPLAGSVAAAASRRTLGKRAAIRPCHRRNATCGDSRH
jgi:hypothetical protein